MAAGWVVTLIHPPRAIHNERQSGDRFSDRRESPQRRDTAGQAQQESQAPSQALTFDEEGGFEDAFAAEQVLRSR